MASPRSMFLPFPPPDTLCPPHTPTHKHTPTHTYCVHLLMLHADFPSHSLSLLSPSLIRISHTPSFAFTFPSFLRSRQGLFLLLLAPSSSLFRLIDVIVMPDRQQKPKSCNLLVCITSFLFTRTVSPKSFLIAKSKKQLSLQQLLTVLSLLCSAS